jgi:hypothetical protein
MFRSAMTLDRANRILTGFAVALLIVIVGLAQAFSRMPAVALAFLLVTLVLAYAMAPTAIAVDAEGVSIERRLWPALRIPRAEIENAAPIDKLGSKALRLFGVGGFFGSYGLFWTDKLGRFRLYGTRKGQAVIVVRKGKLLPLVVTPDDVAGTIAAIDTRLDA